MKLDAEVLFRSGGIDCFRAIADPQAGTASLVPARAVFITESTVCACRAPGVSTGSRALRDFNLGDIVVAQEDATGHTRGFIAPNGQDAGLLLEIEDQGMNRVIPFTGIHMLTARQTLLAAVSAASAHDLHLRRALSAIDEMFELIRAADDVDRFSDDLRGLAFHAAMLDQSPATRVHVPMEALGRFCLASRLRASLQAIDPTHPDAIAARGMHDDIINDLGVSPDARSTGSVHDGRGHATPVDMLLRAALGKITSTPPARIEASILEVSDLAYLEEALDPHRLTGPWVDAFSTFLRAQIQAPGHLDPSWPGSALRPVITLAAIDGRDLLLVGFPFDATSAVRHVLSWPTSDRHLVSPIDGGAVMNLSPEDIPDRQEVERLAASLRMLRLEGVMESPDGRY